MNEKKRLVRQSIKGSIYSYLGIVVGAFYTVFMVKVLFRDDPSQWGVIQSVMSNVALLSPFCLIGLPNIMIKYWPKMVTPEDKNIFITYSYLHSFLGVIIVLAVVYIVGFDSFYMQEELDKYPLIPIWFTYGVIIMTILSINFSYAQVNHQASFSIALRDSFPKFWVFGLLILFHFKLLDYFTFINFHFFHLIAVLVFLIFMLKKTNLFPYRVNLNISKKIDVKSVFKYGTYSMLGASAAQIASRIDILMIGKIMGLEYVAYYSIALFFLAFVKAPHKVISTASVPLVSESWNSGNLERVNQIQKTTSFNLYLISVIITFNILACIDEVMLLLGDIFGNIKYTVIIILIPRILESTGYMIATTLLISKHYKYDVIFQVGLMFFSIITNLIFIPMYGLEGAAIATGITLIIMTTARLIFFYKKYKMSPFSVNMIPTLMIAIIASALVYFIDLKLPPLISIIIKSSIYYLVCIGLIYKFKLSNDINELLLKFMRIKN